MEQASCAHFDYATAGFREIVRNSSAKRFTEQRVATAKCTAMALAFDSLNDCFWRIVLKKSVAQMFGMLQGVRARESLFALRPALGQAAGLALPAFGGSGRWQPA